MCFPGSEFDWREGGVRISQIQDREELFVRWVSWECGDDWRVPSISREPREFWYFNPEIFLVANVVSFPGLSRCCFGREAVCQYLSALQPCLVDGVGVDASASCRPPPSTGFGALFGGGLSCLGLPPPPTGGGLEASLAPPLPPAPTSHSMLCSYIPDCKQLHCNQNRHCTPSSSVQSK